ncbi:hypothetical protein PILCRDRAFT_78168 [Piloderma croceum F 1598]|uniref:Uncharacterized protein n=1 Tax=Piloderma croceum (strain F 1598) TaxID=765440 RepID=A0A0C3F7W4_PILCF|nr:hypothetical protein PILCRDRAFT_78168 [Piloderma croceum F 1598]
MNSVNASTGFSGFQLHLRRSPWVIPPIIPNKLPVELYDAGQTATMLIDRLNDDVAQAHDNLLLVKITQIHHTSQTHGPDPQFNINDLMMLATMNR